MCEEIRRERRNTRDWEVCRVARLLAGYRDATPTNICSASQLAEDANGDLKLFGCCSLCTVTMKGKSTVSQLPPKQKSRVVLT